MNDLERPQVFICPLNINANHSTLLEINEQTKMIYHYNSMRRKSTLVQRVVKAEFKDLGFGYTEAPTPQQKYGWSCGPQVLTTRVVSLVEKPHVFIQNEVRVFHEVVRFCDEATAI